MYELFVSFLPLSLENLLRSPLPEFNCPVSDFCEVLQSISSPFAGNLASLQTMVSYAVVTNADEYVCGENIGFLSGKVCQIQRYSLALEMQQ